MAASAGASMGTIWNALVREAHTVASAIGRVLTVVGIYTCQC